MFQRHASVTLPSDRMDDICVLYTVNLGEPQTHDYPGSPPSLDILDVTDADYAPLAADDPRRDEAESVAEKDAAWLIDRWNAEHPDNPANAA